MTKLNDTFKLSTGGIEENTSLGSNFSYSDLAFSLSYNQLCSDLFSLFFGTHFSEPFRAFAFNNVIKELLLLTTNLFHLFLLHSLTLIGSSSFP